MIENYPPQEEQPPQPLVIEAPEDDAKPVVAYALIGISIAIYLLQVLTKWQFGLDIPAALGVKANAQIMAGQYWRLFTPALLHGSPVHIFFNMYALYVIGFGLEKRFGHLRFALLYIAGAFAGNVLSFLLSANPSLGASTSIFGLLGAELVFYYKNKELFGPNAKRAIQQVVTVAAINFIIGLTPGIDNWGHLGGFLGGLLYAWISGPILQFTIEPPVIRVVEPGKSTFLSVVGLLAVLLIFSALMFTKINI